MPGIIIEKLTMDFYRVHKIKVLSQILKRVKRTYHFVLMLIVTRILLFYFI